MTVDFLQFIFNLILAGFTLRTIRVMITEKNPDSALAKALAYIY